jgi:hypothetical protein
MAFATLGAARRFLMANVMRYGVILQCRWTPFSGEQPGWLSPPTGTSWFLRLWDRRHSYSGSLNIPQETVFCDSITPCAITPPYHWW